MSTFYTWTVAFLSTLVPCLSPTFGTVVYHLHWVPQWRASRLTSIIKGQQAVREISPMLMRSARRARTQRREMAREAKSERSKHFHTSHLGRAAHLLNIKNTSVWCHEQCLQTHTGHCLGTSVCFPFCTSAAAHAQAHRVCSPTEYKNNTGSKIRTLLDRIAKLRWLSFAHQI